MNSLEVTLLPTPYSLLPTPHSLLPTPYSLLPTPYSLLPTPHSLLQPTIFISVQVLILVVVEYQLADQKHQDCGFDNRLYPVL
ncbi:MAG: hypothetical protein F6J90_13920 [Moorea sp. SIOASIH]|uniref:hypothetical protein n=1 Tax=Moorena sp. SIOASIH TaxID=2607817 RepID=UPI0013BD0321|nr:hypothetical protein [Moorena sp. SIOASIH]NEO37362.1 hypothetical protein [Moorena sp. SIOASIH]